MVHPRHAWPWGGGTGVHVAIALGGDHPTLRQHWAMARLNICYTNVVVKLCPAVTWFRLFLNCLTWKVEENWTIPIAPPGSNSSMTLMVQELPGRHRLVRRPVRSSHQEQRTGLGQPRMPMSCEGSARRVSNCCKESTCQVFLERHGWIHRHNNLFQQCELVLCLLSVPMKRLWNSRQEM